MMRPPMGVLGKALSLLRGPDRRLRAAQRAEVEGRLADAVAKYLEAGARDEAARVYCIRADAAPTPRERYQLLGQAISVAGPDAQASFVLRRAELALELLRTGALTLTRPELAAMARDCERSGGAVLAADLFDLAGDAEGRTRALVEAGAVERLERVLEREAANARAERQLESEQQRVLDLEACGRRREALALCDAVGGSDERVQSVASRLRAKRAVGDTFRLRLNGEAVEVAFGQPVTVGRSEATIVLPAPGLSRQHLEIRTGANGPEVCDLGSRNGTTMRGMRLEAPLSVGSGVELELAGQVSVRLAPLAPRGVALEASGRTFLLPLGPLEIEGLRLERADDGWLELESEVGAFLGGLRLDPRVQLCVGDRIATSMDGAALIEVLA